MAKNYESLGIDLGSVIQGDPKQDPQEFIVEWANDVIEDLKESLDKEISSGTSKALRQSMKVVPSVSEVLGAAISMLDYYDYTNKGVEGIGGTKKNGDAYDKRPQLGVYSFKKSPIKVDDSLRQWANNKGLSEYALAHSIAHRGIEGTKWYDNVVTDQRIKELSEGFAKVSGKVLGVSIKNVLEKKNGNRN